MKTLVIYLTALVFLAVPSVISLVAAQQGLLAIIFASLTSLACIILIEAIDLTAKQRALDHQALHVDEQSDCDETAFFDAMH